jgi:hypothetical protein
MRKKAGDRLDGHNQLELLDRDSGAEFVICAQNRTRHRHFSGAACLLSLDLDPSETCNASAHIQGA